MFGYMKQLDGLRTIAVFAVIAQHTLSIPEDSIVQPGQAGVLLFFVLSGFLITGILLQARSQSEKMGLGKGTAYRAFYVRRFLRIFPLYYAVLGFCVALDLYQARETCIWHLSYLSNVYCYYLQSFPKGFAHFWSLAVEEQFYLLWPAIILLVSERWLKPVIVLFVITGLMFRTVGYYITGNVWIQFLTPSAFDALGIGALLALLKAQSPSIAKKFVAMSFASGVVLLFLMTALRWNDSLPALMRIALGSLPVVLVSAWLVEGAASGFQGPGRCLQSPIATYLGKISYGIYVWHNLIGGFAAEIVRRFDVWVHFPYQRGFAQFAYVSIATVALASISWIVLERPLNDCKRFFTYTPQPRRGTGICESRIAV